MATPASPTSSSLDPQTVQAQEALDEGTRYLEIGDFDKAAKHYQKSIDIKETAIGEPKPPGALRILREFALILLATLSVIPQPTTTLA